MYLIDMPTNTFANECKHDHFRLKWVIQKYMPLLYKT